MTRGEDALESVGTVAIVGRPNVGKSALFNKLAGRNIAIVHDQPGITRDWLSATSRRGQRPFTILDTGGIGGAGEVDLSKQVRIAADAAIRESKVVLLVVDGQAGLNPIDQELAKLLRKSKRAVILVVNKIDHPKHEPLEGDFARLGFPVTISISAAHGRGISELVETIDSLLPADPSIKPAGHQTSNIKHPLALAIIGKPNAGKSSLINSILRDTRTIVSELPGTTRDSVDVSYERNGESFVLIDTAGIRARSKHSSSVEVFSVMRAERSIRRAHLCVLVLDLTISVTSQDKKIAGLIQQAEKPSLIVLNKWDLVKPKRAPAKAIQQIITTTREQLFFLEYAPLLIASAFTGENVEMLFDLIMEIRHAAGIRIGTGVLNRLLRAAFMENPPPPVAGRRLKLFYAAQAGKEDENLETRKPGSGCSKDRTPEAIRLILFVNQPKLLTDTYRRYLVGRIRAVQPYPGLPVLLSCRARRENV